MAIDADGYLRQLQTLLPRGAVWPLKDDAVLAALLLGFADELARVDSRGDVLIDEGDPRATFELLPDWERNAGLPDPCVGAGQGTQQRRNALTARLKTLGGQSPAYYIAVAAALGYPITITEFRPHTCDDDCEYPLYSDDWAYAWQVNAPTASAGDFSVEDSVDDDLGYANNAPLMCVMSRLKPAHTTVLFNFS